MEDVEVDLISKILFKKYVALIVSVMRISGTGCMQQRHDFDITCQA